MQPINLEAILPHLWISGRSSRAEWWRVHIICAVFAVMLEHSMVTQLAPRADGTMPSISLLWPLASLALAWVSFASVVRRFHDRGKSGWWALLYFMPGIGWLWILIECGFLPSKPAVNYTFNPAPAPAPTPAAARTATSARRTPAPASRSAARLQNVTRVGTVQRSEYRPWDRKRMVKLAGNAISLIIVAILAYKVFLGPSGQAIFTDLQQPFKLSE